MTLLTVFELVAAGRIETTSLWVCPMCRHGIGEAIDPNHRDRLALEHCLGHEPRSPGYADGPRAIPGGNHVQGPRDDDPRSLACLGPRSGLLTSSRSWRAWLAALAVLLCLGVGRAQGQIAEGNVDQDGKTVPSFPVPAGSVSILNSGEGALSIPLAVPPGVRRVAPTLSLEYSSAAGDEGLGAGWGLRLGYPDAILRTTRFGVPSYTEQDVFTYDGQDLVPIAIGRYKTRIDNFQRIERTGDVWVVTDGQGVRLEYGSDGDSRSRVMKGIYAWHLSRVSDPLGNTILFEYGGPENARRLERIAYTLDANSSPVGQLQEVLFDWQPRPDSRSAANFGELIVRDHRLVSIETTSSGAAVRTYELCYAGDACSPLEEPLRQNSLLAALLEVAADGTELPAREFVYQEREPGWAADSRAEAYSLPLAFTIHRGYSQVNTADLLVWDTGVRPVDVNGDGFVDLVHGVGLTGTSYKDVWLHDGRSGWSKVTDGSWQLPYFFVTESALSTRRVDQGVRIQDVNGDGLPDLLESFGSLREIRLNNGRGWNAPGEYRLPEPPGDPHAFMFVHADAEHAEDRGVRMADLNGDGLVDLIKAREGQPRRVYLNNGVDGWDAAPSGEWSLPPDFYFLEEEDANRYTDTGLRLVDVNADGLTDLVRAFCDFCRNIGGKDIREIWLNHGSGWARSSWDFPGFFIENWDSGIGMMRWDFGVQMSDLNGDGYPDVVVRIAGDPGVVYLNDQSNGFVKVDWDVPVSTVARVNRVRGGRIISWHYIDNGMRLIDVDGDGLADILQGLIAPTRNWVATHLAEPGLADLMTEYTTPLGGTAAIAYQKSNGFGLPPGQMPFTRTVARRLSESGRMDPVMTTDYQFREGYYDWREREFRGFRRVIETRSDATRMEREFYVDRGRKGRLRRETLVDTDGLAYQELQQTFSGAQPDARDVYRTLLDRQERTRFHQDDDSQSATRISEYFYDGYGNLQVTREIGYSGNVERSSVTTFAVNESRWIVSLPSAVYRLEGNFQTLLSVEEHYYDALPLGRVNQGLLTRRILRDPRLQGLQLYGSDGTPGPVSPGSSVIEEAFEHDAYGNVVLERNGRGFATRSDYAGNGFLFPFTVTRDNPGGRPIVRTTLYDVALGVMTEETDPNGQVTRYAYDGLGRLSSIAHPDDPPGDPGIRVTDYHLTSLPVYMEVEERLDDFRTRVRREYLDGLGRPKGKVAGNRSEWVLSDVTRYDARGRAQWVYEPAARASAGFTTYPAAPATRYDYEDDRISVTTHPGGAKTIDVHTADGVHHTDENGELTVKRFNAFGELVEVTNAAGTTTYDYDGLGGLRRTVDPRGLVTQTFYDARGLLRGVSDPDGRQPLRNGFKVWNDYDEQGNKTYRWSGSDVWRAHFDALDRQTALYVSRDFDRSFKAESLYYYDRGTNGLGRLGLVIGYGPPVTWNVLSYDVRGRVTGETFGFRNLDSTLANASIAYTYDRDGAVEAVRDPRGRWLEYRRNYLSQIDGSLGGSAISYNRAFPGGIIDVDYDAAGRVNAVHYGHNVMDVFGYDARGRMTSIMGSGPLQVNYRYDPVGNLLSETFLDGPVNNRTVLQYDYDRTHRLTGSTGSISGQALALEYGYDASGNLLSVSGSGATPVAFQYVAGTNRLASMRSGGRPSIGMRYDPNGHLTDLDDPTHVRSRSHGYDALGRLRTYRTETTSGSIVYDGRGRKIQRSLPGGGKEIYFHATDGQVLATYRKEASGPEWTTYLLADGKRLALVDHEDQFAYIHADRLGSARAITAYKSPQGECLDCESTPGKCIPVPCPTVFELLWKADYLPFGSEVDSEGEGDNFRFTGQELEPSLGIYDYGARYYDPFLRRFLQLDTFLGFPERPATLNRYAYAIDNPLRYTDPDGRCPVCIGVVLLGVFLADAMDPNPANAPTPQDEATGNVFEGKSDVQFALERGLSAGMGGVGKEVVAKTLTNAPKLVQKGAEKAIQIGGTTAVKKGVGALFGGSEGGSTSLPQSRQGGEFVTAKVDKTSQTIQLKPTEPTGLVIFPPEPSVFLKAR